MPFSISSCPTVRSILCYIYIYIYSYIYIYIITCSYETPPCWLVSVICDFIPLWNHGFFWWCLIFYGGWDESNRGVPVYPLLFITGLFQVVIHQQLGYTWKSLEEVWYFWCDNGMLRNSTCCGWSGWSSGVPWIFERFISHIKNGDASRCRLWVLSTEVGDISSTHDFMVLSEICWVFTSPYCWWEPHNILYLVYSFFGFKPTVLDNSIYHILSWRTPFIPVDCWYPDNLRRYSPLPYGIHCIPMPLNYRYLP